MNPSLIRIGLLAGSAVVAKLVLANLASKNFDLKTPDKLLEDLKGVVDELRQRGEYVASGVERLTEIVSTLQKGEYENIEGVIADCNLAMDHYKTLPKAVQMLVGALTDVEKRVYEVATHALVQEGWRILGEKAPGKRELCEHVSHQYLGLYYLSLAGGELGVQDQQRLAADLRHFHDQLGRPTDAALVDWYQTIGVGKKVPLHLLLATCPEIIALRVNSAIIARLFGEEVEVDDVDILRLFD